MEQRTEGGLVLLRLILMGAPGSGKGTQAELLVEQFGILHISTGEMLRDAIDRRTDLGGLVEPYMAHGRLVPDHHVIRLVEDRLGQPDIEAGFILDGFPRTLRQVHAMDELMEGQGLTLDGVIVIDVSEETVVERTSGRRVDPETGKIFNLNAEGVRPPAEILSRLEQRDDDSEGVIRQRMVSYHNETDPAVEEYAQRGQLIRIDGSAAPDAVFDELRRRLESVEQGS